MGAAKTKDELSRNPDFQKQLSMRDFPFKLWILGALIICAAIFLLINSGLSKSGKGVTKSFDGKWWGYFVSIIIFIVGVSFVIAGRIEIISFDKEVL